MKNMQLRKDFDELFDTRKGWMDNLDNTTILVTGITGFIGSVLAKAIMYYNQKFGTSINIIGLARSEKKVEEVFEERDDNTDFRIVYGDILSPFSCDNRIDYVIHCANTTSSKEYVEKPVETIKTIVHGTDMLLNFAKRKEAISVVYLSSMEVYGVQNNENDRITEIEFGYVNPLNVRSSYSEGKRLAECICVSYAHEYKLNVKIARLAQVFGAGINRLDTRVFMQIANSAITGNDFVLHSDGSSYGNYCYITDAVKGILMILQKGTSGEAYNVVNEESCTTIKDLAYMVSNEIAEFPFRIVYDIPESTLIYGYAPKTAMRLSGEKIRLLGWEPEVSLREMFVRLINNLREYV